MPTKEFFNGRSVALVAPSRRVIDLHPIVERVSLLQRPHDELPFEYVKLALSRAYADTLAEPIPPALFALLRSLE